MHGLRMDKVMTIHDENFVKIELIAYNKYQPLYTMNGIACIAGS